MGNRASIIYGRTDGADAGVNLPVKVEAYGDGTGVVVTSELVTTDTTLSVCGGSVTVAAAATDVVTFSVDSFTGYLRRIIVSGTATAAGAHTVLLKARSTEATGGTSTSVDAKVIQGAFAASGALMFLYTANPTVGTDAGTLAQQFLQVSTSAAGVTPAPLVFDFRDSPILLTEAGQEVAINLNGATIAGLVLNVWAEFERIG